MSEENNLISLLTVKRKLSYSAIQCHLCQRKLISCYHPMLEKNNLISLPNVNRIQFNFTIQCQSKTILFWHPMSEKNNLISPSNVRETQFNFITQSQKETISFCHPMSEENNLISPSNVRGKRSWFRNTKITGLSLIEVINSLRPCEV